MLDCVPSLQSGLAECPTLLNMLSGKQLQRPAGANLRIPWRQFQGAGGMCQGFGNLVLQKIDLG
jgi:hypothetical protein